MAKGIRKKRIDPIGAYLDSPIEPGVALAQSEKILRTKSEKIKYLTECLALPSLPYQLKSAIEEVIFSLDRFEKMLGAHIILLDRHFERLRDSLERAVHRGEINPEQLEFHRLLEPPNE
jgi:hypothetical protein